MLIGVECYVQKAQAIIKYHLDEFQCAEWQAFAKGNPPHDPCSMLEKLRRLGETIQVSFNRFSLQVLIADLMEAALEDNTLVLTIRPGSPSFERLYGCSPGYWEVDKSKARRELH
jgi:hypothetical protein